MIGNCAACHGEDGKKGISGAADLSSSKLSDKEIEDTFKKIQKEEKNPLYAKFYEKPEDMQ